MFRGTNAKKSEQREHNHFELISLGCKSYFHKAVIADSDKSTPNSNHIEMLQRAVLCSFGEFWFKNKVDENNSI